MVSMFFYCSLFFKHLFRTCNNKHITLIITTVHYSHQNAFVFKAQERVLERKDHVIKTEGQEEIRVSLRCEHVAESCKQPSASANQVNGTVTKQTPV